MKSPKVISLALTLVIIAISRPALPQSASSSDETVIINEKGGVTKWRTSTTTSDFNIECRGRIELTDDDKDIKSISDDGYLEITKTVFGSKRRIIIESLGSGKIKKEYYEGRTQMDWNQSGKAWLAEVLPDLVRSSTIGAEARVNRIFQRGGASAVLTELDQIKSDYVKAHYGSLLLQKNIPAADIPKVINILASGISSDYYLSTILKDSMSKLLVNSESADAFFRATEKIASDYYRSVVLKEAIREYAASPDQVKTILRSASGISSDYYLSVVLTTLLEESDVKEESLSELVNISKNISSDYYRTEVLHRCSQKKAISKATLKNIISALADVGSDYYKTNVFNSLAENNTLDPEVQLQVLQVLDESVSSDYYASVTLSKILAHQKLSDESFQQLVRIASELGSSNYGADVLQSAARKDLSPVQLTHILKVAGNINSEHYLTTVLQALAPKVKAGDAAMKEAYRQAAKNIRSETYYGRALKAIE